MSNCLLINTGSRPDNPVKVFLLRNLPEESSLEEIKLESQQFPAGATYKEQAKIIAPRLAEAMSEVNFILFRCPALKQNILGLTELTPELTENFSEKTVLKHGSEIAFWLADELSRKYGVPAVFSRGIPTNKLPEAITTTGHPEIKNYCLSHWEAVEGIAQHKAAGGPSFAKDSERQKKKFSDISFVMVMLGSGIGVYGWENEAITAFKIRHSAGPMSSTSIGGGIDVLSLMDWQIKKGTESLKAAREAIGALSGGKGGFQSYNPEWGDLKKFRKAVEEKDEMALKLFEALVLQIASCVGAARFSMSTPLDRKIPICFFGGGANWQYLVERIIGKTAGLLFSEFEVVDYDPEMKFFVSQAKEFALGL